MSLLDPSQQFLPLEWQTRLLCVVQFISTNISHGENTFRPVYCGIQAVELALGGQYIKRRCPSARVSFLVNGSSRFASSVMHMYTSLLDIILMHMDMHMQYPNLGRTAVIST